CPSPPARVRAAPATRRHRAPPRATAVASRVPGVTASRGGLRVSFRTCVSAVPGRRGEPDILAAFNIHELQMATYGMNDVKNGMKILVNNDPCIITDTEYVKPGKGQAFTRVKYRNIKSGRVQEITMKATDSL